MRGFWSRGNYPTQVLEGLTAPQVLLYLKAQVLLVDDVVGAASYYFESPVTRTVVEELQPLFRDGCISFFIDRDYQDFREHGLRKRAKSPAGMDAYSDKDTVIEIADRLAKISPMTRREPADISRLIEVLLLEDIADGARGSIGWSLRRELDPRRVEEVRQTLADVLRARETDLVWEYLEPHLKPLSLPARVVATVRRRLAEAYTKASASVVKAFPEMSVLGWLDEPVAPESAYDPRLLLAVFRVLGIANEFAAMSAERLLELRRSLEWLVFRKYYQDLVEHVSNAHGAATEYLSLARSCVEFEAQAKPTNQNLVMALQEAARACGIAEGPMVPIGVALQRATELLGGNPHDLIIERIRALSTAGREDTTGGGIEGGSLMDGLRSFIVHGHDRATTYELKDYLQNTLGWPVPTILEQQPGRGRTIIESFEAHASEADVVFVVMSPDDTGSTDAAGRRARQNVVYEMGYFVGRLGRLSGRVILLHGGNLELPSDLGGVLYVDISGGIVLAGERIRREVSGLCRLP